MTLINKELRNQNQGKFLNAYSFQDNPTKLLIISIESRPRLKMGAQVEANYYTFVEPESGEEKIIHNDSKELFTAFDSLKVEENDLVIISTSKQENNGREYLSWKVEKVGAGTPPKKEEVDPNSIPF